MPRVLISVNAAWNVVNFRGGLVRALVADGHEVVVAVPDDGHLHRVEALGARVVVLPMTSRSLSVIGDLLLFLRYLRLMQRERPGVFLGWTIKPNVYGSLAARCCGVKIINNISGLGTGFMHGRWLRLVVRGLYRLALSRSATVFFQNGDDRDLFLERGLVRPDQAALLPGSGVDTRHFAPGVAPGDGRLRFLMIARLIRDKGVHEFVAAARMVRARHPDVLFQLLGPCDVDNRTAVDGDTLRQWRAQGVVDYLGEAQDVRPFLDAADCVVLPSYREGLSRVLLEAGAMQKPTITSDVPGCRDAIVPGVTGLLCAPRDADALATAMEAMIAMGRDAREAMGKAARNHVIHHFSELTVIGAYRYAISRNGDKIC